MNELRLFKVTRVCFVSQFDKVIITHPGYQKFFLLGQRMLQGKLLEFMRVEKQFTMKT